MPCAQSETKELRRELKEAAAAGKKKDAALRKAQDAAAAEQEQVPSSSPELQALACASIATVQFCTRQGPPATPLLQQAVLFSVACHGLVMVRNQLGPKWGCEYRLFESVVP